MKRKEKEEQKSGDTGRHSSPRKERLPRKKEEALG